MPPPGAEALGEGVGVQKSVRAPYPHPKCSAPLGAPGKGDGPGAGYLLGVGAVRAGRSSRITVLEPHWLARALALGGHLPADSVCRSGGRPGLVLVVEAWPATQPHERVAGTLGLLSEVSGGPVTPKRVGRLYLPPTASHHT